MSDGYYDLCRKLQPAVTEILGGDSLVVYNHVVDAFMIVDMRLRVAWTFYTREEIFDNIHTHGGDEAAGPRLQRFKRFRDGPTTYEHQKIC